MSDGTFIDGCLVVEVGSSGDIQGPPGDDGADAAPPARAEFLPSEVAPGQTRFPPTGTFATAPWTDNHPPFSYVAGIIDAEVNGVGVPSSDFSAPGGSAAITFTTPMVGDETVTFASFRLEGEDIGTALKRMPFGIGKSAYDKIAEAIAIDDVRTSQASDQDRLALAELIDGGYRTIYARGGQGVGTEKGEYPIGAYPWAGVMPGRPSNSTDPLDMIEHRGNLSCADGTPAHGLHIRGDGPGLTEFDIGDRNYLFAHNSMSEDTADNLKGFLLSDLALRGKSVENGFGEPLHLIALAGVTGFRARNVHWLAPQGDGTIAWMGPRPDTVRHNEDWAFLDCLFDGINKQNRNGLTVEDLVGLRVLASTFRRLSLPDMPAAIDVEPRNRTSYRVGNIFIGAGTRFEDLGSAALAIYAHPDYYTRKATNFTLADAIITDAPRGVDVVGVGPDEMASSVNRQNITIAGNQMTRVTTPLRSQGGFGVSFRRNALSDFDSIQLGVIGGGFGNREVRIQDNPMVRGGKDNGPVILHDGTTIACRVERNPMTQCGRTDGVAGWAFLARLGNIDCVVSDNPVDNSSGRLKAFAQMSDGVTVSATSEKVGNTWRGVAADAADNFNPPKPVTGVVATYTITGAAAVIAPGGRFAFDTPVSGATNAKFFRAKLNLNLNDLSPGGRPIIGCAVTQVNVVDVAVFNAGTGNLTIPIGAVIQIEEY